MSKNAEIASGPKPTRDNQTPAPQRSEELSLGILYPNAPLLLLTCLESDGDSFSESDDFDAGDVAEDRLG